MRAVAEVGRVAVCSGHKTGKSLTAAVLGLWWAATRPLGRVVLTAPTNHQIRNILWRELRICAARARMPLPHVPDLPGVGMRWDDGREIIGFSTDEAEAMAGISGPAVLWIIDEASGVGEDIWEAIEGNQAGGVHMLALSNPTQPVGTFYDAFHDAADFWTTFHVPSLEPAALDPPIPGLATQAWCEDRLRVWGPTDPRYLVRVLGDFAGESTPAIIMPELVQAAKARWKDTEASGRLDAGLDVARYGADWSFLAIRRGRKVVELAGLHGAGSEAVANWALEKLAAHRRPGEPKPLLRIDAIGVGLGPAVALRRSGEVEVLEVVVSERANDEERYSNLRSELWFGLAHYLRDGGALPPDPFIEAELCGCRYKFDARGRLQVERKDDLKKRLRRSPDRADALCLCTYSPALRLAAPMPVHHRETGYRLGNMARGF